jgi:hypothetical protein
MRFLNYVVIHGHSPVCLLLYERLVRDSFTTNSIVIQYCTYTNYEMVSTRPHGMFIIVFLSSRQTSYPEIRSTRKGGNR